MMLLLPSINPAICSPCTACKSHGSSPATLSSSQFSLGSHFPLSPSNRNSRQDRRDMAMAICRHALMLYLIRTGFSIHRTLASCMIFRTYSDIHDNFVRRFFPSSWVLSFSAFRPFFPSPFSYTPPSLDRSTDNALSSRQPPLKMHWTPPSLSSRIKPFPKTAKPTTNNTQQLSNFSG